MKLLFQYVNHCCLFLIFWSKTAMDKSIHTTLFLARRSKIKVAWQLTSIDRGIMQWDNNPTTLPPLATPKYHCNAVALSRALIHIYLNVFLRNFYLWLSRVGFPVHGYTKMAAPLNFCRGMWRSVNWHLLTLRNVITCEKTCGEHVSMWAGHVSSFLRWISIHSTQSPKASPFCALSVGFWWI